MRISVYYCRDSHTWRPSPPIYPGLCRHHTRQLKEGDQHQLQLHPCAQHNWFGEGLRVSPMMCLCRPDLRLIIAIGHFRIKSCTYFPPFFWLINITSGQRFQEMKRGLKIEIKYIMLNTAENVPGYICWIIWCPTVS